MPSHVNGFFNCEIPSLLISIPIGFAPQYGHFTEPGNSPMDLGVSNVVPRICASVSPGSAFISGSLPTEHLYRVGHATQLVPEVHSYTKIRDCSGLAIGRLLWCVCDSH